LAGQYAHRIGAGGALDLIRRGAEVDIVRRGQCSRRPAQHDVARHIDGAVLRLRIARGFRLRHAVFENIRDLLLRKLAVVHGDFVDRAEELLATVRAGLSGDHDRPIVRIHVHLPDGLGLALHLAVHVDVNRLVAERACDEMPFIVDHHGRRVRQRGGVVDEELQPGQADVLSQDQIETRGLPLGFVDDAAPVRHGRRLDPGQQTDLGGYVVLGYLRHRHVRAADELQRRALMTCDPDSVSDDGARVAVTGGVPGGGAGAVVEGQVQDQGFVHSPSLCGHQAHSQQDDQSRFAHGETSFQLCLCQCAEDLWGSVADVVRATRRCRTRSTSIPSTSL